MKAEEFRRLEAPALEEELKRRRRELVDIRCRVALGEDIHAHQVRTLRKDIARIRTVMREQSAATVAGTEEAKA